MSGSSDIGGPARLADLGPADWLIRRDVGREDRPSPRVRVRDMIPRGFEAYMKMLHPFTGDMSQVPPNAPILQSLIAGEWPKVDEDYVLQRGTRGRWFERTKVRRVRWAEVAGFLGTQLSPHSGMRDLERGGNYKRALHRFATPNESYLDRELRDALIEGLSAALEPLTKCYLLWEPHVAMETDWDCVDYVLCSCTLAQFSQWEDNPPHQPFPSYLWPADRSWVVFTDLESWYSLLGGPDDLVGRVESDSRIESLRVDEDQQMYEP